MHRGCCRVAGGSCDEGTEGDGCPPGQGHRRGMMPRKSAGDRKTHRLIRRRGIPDFKRTDLSKGAELALLRGPDELRSSLNWANAQAPRLAVPRVWRRVRTAGDACL